MRLGIVVEYAGATGAPIWRDLAPTEWDYSQFAAAGRAPEPDQNFTLTFRDIGSMNGSKFDTWTINNQSWPKIDPLHVRQGRRYRMILRNGSGDRHPIHWHCHQALHMDFAQFAQKRNCTEIASATACADEFVSLCLSHHASEAKTTAA